MNLTEFDLQQLENLYEANSPEIAELKEVIKAIIKEKTFRFFKEDTIKRFPLSISSKWLIEDGGIQAGKDTTLSEDPISLYALMRGLEFVAPYDFTKPLVDLVAFIDKCKVFFDNNGVVIGGWMLERLRQFMFIATFRAGHYDPMAQINFLPANHIAYRLLYNTFFKNVSIWNYTFDKFWTTASLFVTTIGEPPSGVWRDAMIAVLEVLEKQQDLTDPKRIVLSVIGLGPVGRMAEIALTTLDIRGELSEEELLSWLDDPAKLRSSIVILNCRPVISTPFAARFWDKIKGLTLTNEQRSLLYQLLVKILDKSTELDADVITAIKDHLLDEIVKAEEEQVIAVVHALQLYTSAKEFAVAVIDRIIELEPNRPNYNLAISNYYRTINDLDGFFTFARRFVMKPERFFKMKHFKVACDHFYSTVPEAYLQYVVEFMIDDWGTVRKAGGRLLSHYLSDQDGSGFQIKPGDMDALQQYKFVVSATAYPALLDARLRVLLPFLQVKSEIVVELVLCRLETEAEMYGSECIEHITPMLVGHLADSAILARLNQAIDAAAEISGKKRAIPEFKAHVAFANLMQPFFKFYGQKNSKTMDNARKDYRGLSSMLKNIDIARGGGTIMPDGSIQPLTTYSASFKIPASVYRDPINEAFDSYNFYSTNWAKEFEPWKDIIFSSGNI